MLAAVQCLTATSGFVFTGCSMIVCGGADSDVDRKHTNATRYTRYTLASTQRKILPARGWRMSLCSCGIMPLSFRKDGTDRTRVQGNMYVVFLSALSRSSFFPRIRIASPLL